MITGYQDSFQRTVSGGLGTATSGQTYTTAAGAGAISNVSAGIASMGPAAANNTNYIGFVDRQTADIDISAQVAIASIPVSGLATVGVTAKQSSNQNYYIGSFMVQTIGIMSIRISKVITGGLVTLNTTLVPGGGAYVAGTYYNIRFQAYWSNLLQTNVLQMKIWPLNTTEPGGWTATTTDSAITQYASGTQAGLHFRDEATTPTNTGRWQNVTTRTYGLPVPATTDPMCQDPAIAYPDQTSLQSLAVAADAALVALDPAADLAGLYPRVRVSANNVSYNMNNSTVVTFDTTEFNIGTSTNLAYDSNQLYLPTGIWMLTAEMRLAVAADNSIFIELEGGPSAGQTIDYFRSHTQQGPDSIGGTAHASAITWNTNPSTPNQYSLGFSTLGSNATYTILYAALTAVKISDYFT